MNLPAEIYECANCGSEVRADEALFGPPIPECGGRSEVYCSGCGEGRDDVSAEPSGMTPGQLGSYFDLW